MAKVCQTCGDRGFEEAILYCDSCKIEVMHRYCVGITPVPFTECIVWICEECDESDSDSDQAIKFQRKDHVEPMEECEESDTKKKKKKKKKSYHTSPVLDVEDHVEPMEVSSSPVTETVKESKSQESSVSGKSHELTGSVRNKVSGSEAEKSSSVPDHSSCTSKRNDCGGSDSKVDENAQPVSAVEDQDATKVKPVEVSSLPVKETVKESNLEAGSLSSGADYNTCTSKLCDSGSDGIEVVNQTDKLRDMSKKNEKERKKNKKKEKTNEEKKSSNHTPPVLTVEDQDATNVEPEKVSSSRGKEAINELIGLVRNVASVSKAEKSSSVPDHSPSTSKRNDSGSYRKEVDQTATLKDILKKREKKRKKTDKEKKSSNHTPPVLTVEDQDATNVEPERVSSSRVKEAKAMNESKRRDSSDSRKPHELTGLVRNVASVSKAEKSSSVPDHSSSTSKKNDSGSDRKEVDQTANLKDILKKGDKKKKNKNKKSSNHSPSVVAVEDHGVQGPPTNVEPVEVSSSSSLKEISESKRQESSNSRKPHELTGLVGDKASVSEAEHSSITQTRNQSSGNRQLADGNSSCKVAESNVAQMSAGLTSKHYRAQPIKTSIWRGLVSVKGSNIDGIVAHVSSLACPKVHETASSLPACLSAEMFPRWEIWPNNFLKNGGPKDDSIALFFFPSIKSNDKKTFHSLVLDMKKKDLAMRCLLDDAILLLFTSYMLPKDCWTFNEKDYLWGVFKPRKTSGS